MPEINAKFLRRIPTTAWLCALIACLNAIAWSFITPPFQVPDEPDHFAYVKQVAETGHLPSLATEGFSQEELATLTALQTYKVELRPQNPVFASEDEQREVKQELKASSEEPRNGSPSAGFATSEPPLYYALEAIPYSFERSGTIVDRLRLMRLLSALFAGFTAMFAYLFIRETIPREPWAWSVGGLAVAVTPLLGFMSGSVNPDSLLFAVSAACFYCLARAFRRGFSMGNAAALGSVTAIGLMTKLNFAGMFPGLIVGMLVLAVQARRVWGLSPYRPLALGLGIALAPVVLYSIINLLSNHPALGIVSTTLQSTKGNLLAQAEYIWQLYLPRLPGMGNDFPGLDTIRQLWFDRWVGLYGWLDTAFPPWVNTLALLPAGAIALLLGRTLLAGRTKLRGHFGELLVYTLIAVGLMVLIGADSFRQFPANDAEYAQPRYFLPLLALFGAAVALAARGAGRRWGPAVGYLIVVLFLAHDVFSQLQAVARYYG